MSSQPAGAALLDVDGTLVDTTFHHAMAWWHACNDCDVPTPLWKLHRLIGMGSDQLVDQLLHDGAPDEAREQLPERWQAHWEDVRDEVRALPGAAELVQALADRGLAVVYATSGRPEDVEHLREVIGADEWVHATVSSGEVERSKPDPAIFRLALDRAGVDATRAVAVGDTTWDAEAAGKAGITCVAVRTGGIGDADLFGAGASGVYDDALDLCRQLDRSAFADLGGGVG